MTWETMCQHIEVLNREMGAVQTSIEWIKYILSGQLTLLVAILALSWRTKYWIKRNGNGQERT